MYEIIDLRQALEAGLIAQIIDIIDDDQLNQLKHQLDELKKYAGQGAAGDDADRAFHEQIFAPLNNQLMSQLLRVFWDVYHDLSGELPRRGKSKRDIVKVHQAIFDAVEARDEAQAVAAIADHFRGIRSRLA